MKPHVGHLIECLREELTQYGELLALMQEQQNLIIRRDAETLQQNLAAVEQQVAGVTLARQAREQARKAIIVALGAAPDITFRQMTAQLPAEYQPLLEALVVEINQILLRVQQWLRQNHLLLSRSLDLMQRMIQSLFPAARSGRTYGRRGFVAPVAPPPSSLYEGIV
ncbi:MAG: flagellar protein FlgN [Pedosphaera sp.]|nr:flagellar protein FlgN [Pedosphaera sp.]MSS99805.1 flagellar protein FlgN [Pedosphaera sp.]